MKGSNILRSVMEDLAFSGITIVIKRRINERSYSQIHLFKNYIVDYLYGWFKADIITRTFQLPVQGSRNSILNWVLKLNHSIISPKNFEV